MKPITYVICAAGEGRRFKEMGIASPKPLIKMKGLTMLERSLSSLEIKAEDQVIVIGREEDALQEELPHLDVEWLFLRDLTRGQLDTFLHASHLIKHEDIVIFNCDTYFKSRGLKNTIHANEYDGIIPCSRQPGDCWSFCAIDANYKVLKVTEKVRISEWASVGYYYFKGKDLLLDLARIECAEVTQEVYVAPLYQRYLAKGLNIRMEPVEEFLPFGTIEQVQDYWKINLEELLKENS